LNGAGTREHGTTHRAPLAVFEAEERSKLLPLPNEPFELVEIKRAKVHPECHAVLDASFYSAPYRYVGQVLDAWIFAHVVRYPRRQSPPAEPRRCMRAAAPRQSFRVKLAERVVVRALTTVGERRNGTPWISMRRPVPRPRGRVSIVASASRSPACTSATCGDTLTMPTQWL
jgi:hypothetical protein